MAPPQLSPIVFGALLLARALGLNAVAGALYVAAVACTAVVIAVPDAHRCRGGANATAASILAKFAILALLARGVHITPSSIAVGLALCAAYIACVDLREVYGCDVRLSTCAATGVATLAVCVALGRARSAIAGK